MKLLVSSIAAMPGVEARLKSLGVELVTVPPDPKEAPLSAELLERANYLFIELPPSNIRETKPLEWVQVCSAGYSQLFDLGLPERGVRTTNGLGNFDIPIAEWNVAMMINLARDLRAMIRNQEHGIWDRPAQFQKEIRGATVGLWGYGGIGRETARLVRNMGLTVHVLSRRGVQKRTNIYCVPGTGDPDGVLPDKVFTAGQELEFLRGLDFLVLTMPITKTTKGIIGEQELRALPRTAYLLNPARGPLVEEAALLRALREGWIAGAALDTHYHYPMPADHPLWRFPNVIMTPHISGSALSPRFPERAWDICIQNAGLLLGGKPLLNELTAEQLRGD